METVMKIADIRTRLHPAADATRAGSSRARRVPQLEGHVLVLTDELATADSATCMRSRRSPPTAAGAQAALAMLAPIAAGPPHRRPRGIDGGDRRRARRTIRASRRRSTWRCTTCWRAGSACRCTCCSAGGFATASRSRASCRSSRRPRWRSRPRQLAEEGYAPAQAQAVRRHRARRRADRRGARRVGPDVRLTLDPNQSYDAKQMMRAFARWSATTSR